MRLHLIGFPHTRLDDNFSTCAFTQKVVKFARMGWDDLFVYSTEQSQTPEGVTLVPCLSEERRLELFGPDDPTTPPKWPTDEQWEEFNINAAVEVLKNSSEGDIILLAGGWSQKSIAESNPHLIACEPGVGYEGIYAPFAAFESYAWQHFVYGRKNMDGRWFDRVIPNYFDPEDFKNLSNEKGEHLLFVGRVVQRKGLQAAADIARATGRPLYVAGPGPFSWENGVRITAPEVQIEGDVHYLGVLGPEERAYEMSRAYALLAPTVYVEPFGGVAVEAMFSGTPVVATDWGAFTETVENAITGFRFRTLREAVAAVDECQHLNPGTIKAHAKFRYSLNAVKPMFQSWFDGLSTIKNGKGWYESA